MSSDEQIRIDSLEETVKKLTSEVESLKGDLSKLSEISKIQDEIKSIQGSLSGLEKKMTPVDKIADIVSSMKSMEKEMAGLTKNKQVESLDKKVDGVIGKLDSFDSRLGELGSRLDEFGSHIDGLKVSDEIASIDKKVDDVLSSVADLGEGVKHLQEDDRVQNLESKIDSLQEYVAGLSAIEEKMETLTHTFDETREIVSIIVRQLDDIERKYNKALGEVSEALTLVQKAISAGRPSEPAPEPSPKKPKEKKPPKVSKDGALPATIDSIMEQLLAMVTPHTEAVDMAQALEETRDRLTELIKESTPVIYEFGKIARELKTYPPTATLNENDIARLNKEIRAWTSKLKEVARG